MRRKIRPRPPAGTVTTSRCATAEAKPSTAHQTGGNLGLRLDCETRAWLVHGKKTLTLCPASYHGARSASHSRDRRRLDLAVRPLSDRRLLHGRRSSPASSAVCPALTAADMDIIPTARADGDDERCAPDDKGSKARAHRRPNALGADRAH
jgi:hypothetical protein